MKSRMKVIIAGTRRVGSRYSEIEGTVIAQGVKDSGFDVTQVVSGTAQGIDRMGESWAKLNEIPIRRFPADWIKYPRAGGYIRNAEMADYADALIVFWDGFSKGSKHMIQCMRNRNKPIFMVDISGYIEA